MPALRRHRSRRGVAVPMLAAAAVLALVVGVDPGRAWTGDQAPVRIAAALLALLLASIAAVLWRGDREASRVRRALASGISHHMRTPLAQIRMFTEMLLMGRERSAEERTAWLEAIERESHRLGDVMENLLLFVHGEEPDPYPARQTVDLGSLLEDVAVGFTGRAAQRRIRLVTDPPAGILVRVDPQALRQAVGNVIDNAIRYGPTGQTITVSLRTGPDGRAIATVRDQGPGIPAADRPRVWNPFVQLDARAAGSEGSGLGLAVVRQVVEAHGGRAWVEDAEGGGAAVHLSLPLATAAAAPPEPALDASHPAGR